MDEVNMNKTLMVNAWMQVGFTVSALLSTLPWLPPDGKFPKYSVEAPPLFRDVLAENDYLNNGEQMFAGTIKGPESFAYSRNILYTGTNDGRIHKIHLSNLTMEVLSIGRTKTGEPGRPLGMRIYNNKKLIVADAYLGIYQVELNKRKQVPQAIIGINKVINDKKVQLPNALDINNNVIYWTDSSTSGDLDSMMTEFLGQPSGRLLAYHIPSKKNYVLKENLHFANGVQLSKDKKYLFVAETFARRIWRFNVKGVHATNAIVILKNLPGMPDNIKLSPRNTLLVGIVCQPTSSNFENLLGKLPFLRRLILRFLFVLDYLFQKGKLLLQYALISALSYEQAKEFRDFSFKPLDLRLLAETGVFIKYGLAIESTVHGKILKSYHNSERNGASTFSELIEVGHYLYLGSPSNDFIWRVENPDNKPSESTKQPGSFVPPPAQREDEVENEIEKRLDAGEGNPGLRADAAPNQENGNHE